MTCHGTKCLLELSVISRWKFMHQCFYACIWFGKFTALWIWTLWSCKLICIMGFLCVCVCIYLYDMDVCKCILKENVIHEMLTLMIWNALNLKLPCMCMQMHYVFIIVFCGNLCRKNKFIIYSCHAKWEHNMALF